MGGMMLQTFTITADVPDEGYEPTGEFRPAKTNEAWIGLGFTTIIGRGSTHFAVIILRPVWKWPEWLTATWIAMDSDGSWCFYEEKPVIEGAVWSDVDGEVSCARHLEWAVSFTPPQCTDWRKSLRQKPV